MAKISKLAKFFICLTILVLLAVLLINSLNNWLTPKTIAELLAENKYLKQAITNLTQEDQIGYAKVIKKDVNEGRLFTTVKFVETSRNDKTKTILEKNYTVEGDIIHFDALIVKFSNQMVQDGKEKSIYLWRRVYGEKMTPENGFKIEDPNNEPARYADMFTKLRMKDKDLFWSNIWDLANNLHKLKEYGIDAVYGNAVYAQLEEGRIYIFKITSTGQLYIEPIPQL
jgi:hypothetical protein